MFADKRAYSRSFPKGATVQPYSSTLPTRTRRRDHAINAVARDPVERLYDEGVLTVYVRGLTDVLEAHWSVRANAKTHNSGRSERLSKPSACVARSTVSTSKRGRKRGLRKSAPLCKREATVRHEDTLTCSCGFQGHADLTASETFLKREASGEVGPMARLARFKWGDHSWSTPSCACPNEQRVNPQVASMGR